MRGSQHGPSEREEGLGLAHGPCPASLSDPVEILRDESTAAKARIAAVIGVLHSLCYKWNTMPAAMVESSAASYV